MVCFSRPHMCLRAYVSISKYKRFAAFGMHMYDCVSGAGEDDACYENCKQGSGAAYLVNS